MKSALFASTFAVASIGCCCGGVFERIASIAGLSEKAPTTPDALEGAPTTVATPPSTAAPSTAAPTDIATGPLTPAAILASADAVAPFHPWAGALAEMQRRLGKPTRVDGDRYAWAVMDGEDCVGTFMEHMTGPAMTTAKGSSTEQVGTYMAGQRFEAGSGNPYFDDCVKDAGGAN